MPPNKKKGKDKKDAKKGSKKPAVRKPLTLKQKQRKESKVVRADSLNWKPVEIPDNLESYEGLYGIEELDGVDVNYVDGRAEFVVKEDKKDEEETLDDDENDEIEDDEEEFTGFDDPVTETKRPSDNDADAKPQKKQKLSNKDDELRENAFVGVDASLPPDTDLPQWSMDGVSLSTYTINGLAGCRFKEPTAIQRKAIPLALQGKDVIGKATTGSGKTLAYGIPILERCLAQLESKTSSVRPPTAMIFAPTRELAHQVVDHMNKIAKYSPLAQNGIVSITGGLSIQKQERLLSHGPSILVATPGRCLELMEKSVDLVNRMALTDIIVLDEADRLLQDGHFEEFEKILDMLNKHRPRKTEGVSRRWQTLVFSATFSRDLFGKLSNNRPRNKESSSFIENDEILSLLNTKLQFRDRAPAVIDANPKEIVSGKVTEALVECGPAERDLYLYYFLLMYPGSTLVFANAIDSVKRLVPFLTNLNIPTFSIHSSMIQKQRLRALERFKAAGEKNQTAVLIASDVAARGLDIPNIDHVAHYHLPRSADVYVHRSGRTARAGKEGVSVMFCSPQEASGPFRKLRKLVADSANKGSRMNMHSDVKLLPIEMDLVTQLKPRVNISAKLANSTISTVSTKKSDSWMKEAAEELGVDMEEEFVDDHLRKQRLRDNNKILTKEQAASLRAELKALLNERLRINKRRSYLTSGVDNLAHQMLTGDSHEAVWGHAKVKALDQLKKRKSTKKANRS